MSNDSTKNTIGITIAVSLVCSILVSAAAVLLKPIQKKNRELDKKRNVLMAGGIYKKGQDIDALFKKIESRVIELKTGKVNKKLDAKTFNYKKSLKDNANIVKLKQSDDLAKLKRIGKYALVYFLKENGKISKLILPIYGKGLWSTMYGFIALSSDCQTIKGITFYSHGETPGLGGEIDNPNWKKSCINKQAFDSQGKLKIKVLKGKVNPRSPDAIHQIDGLSGATLTGRGVNNLIRFWLGENGFGPFIARLKKMGKKSLQMENI